MDITRYKELTGNTVSSSEEASVLAHIDKARRILEDMLGYTLDSTLLNINYFEGADVVNAFRLFPYDTKNRYFHIDPASAIHSIALVRDDEVLKTLDDDDYGEIKKHGFIKYIEQDCAWWCVCKRKMGIQIAVDADWLWEENEIPEDLLYVWADMVEYYSDDNNKLRSQTLGTHSYTRFKVEAPESKEKNKAILRKYAGGYGSIVKKLT
jgi:hypothetical protein